MKSCLTRIEDLFENISFIFCQLITFFVKLWQMTRKVRNFLFFPQCRFYPSCSDYLIECLNRHGLIKGIVFSVKRLIKCHPLCEGGIDEVPVR